MLDTTSPDERWQQALEACKARYVIAVERQERANKFGVETLWSANLLIKAEGGVPPRTEILPEMTCFNI